MMQQATQLQVSPNGQSSYQPVPNLPDKAGTLRPQLQMSPSGQSSYQPVPSLPDKAGTLRPQLQMSPSGQSSYQPVPSLPDKAGTLRPQLQMSPSGQSSYQPVPNLQDKAGTLRPQLQMSPSGKSSYQPVPNLQVKAGTRRAQPTHEPPASKETLLQQPDKDETVARRVPRLQAVVESQAFKNVLVDEMDMMLSRAATLIQANWRGYQLRQKLISQMMAAQAIQEAWRRFNTRRLLRSGKTMEKKAKAEEGDIPYHPPQLVRFLHPEEGRSLLTHPTMVSKETQFPSSDSLATYTHQLALQQSQGMSQPGTCSVGGPNVPFLPHQTVAIRLPCPVSPDAKGRPCLFTRTIRSAYLVHAEGHTKTRPVTARANKAGTPGPPPSGRCTQAVQGQLKIQTQTHMEAEVLKVPPAGPAHVITKTPLQPCPGSTVTTKTPPQIYLAAPVTKMPPQMYPAVPMTKTPAQTCPAATMAKTPPQTCPPATVTKTPLQACLAAMVNKIQRQPCPGPAITITKTPPQPCPATPVTKTPAQMRPSGSMTNTSPQTRPAATMTKASPQLFLLASMIRSPTQTQPAATMTKAPPQTWAGPVMAKAPPQVLPVATMAKTPLQTSQAATMAKTPSHQRFQGASVNKTPPPQTRLAAMITKTPAQLRSVATILRTLCLPPPAAGHLKPPFSAAAAAGTPDSSSHTCLSGPKAKAVVNARQAAGVVKVSSRSYLTEGKVKCLPPSHLGAGAPKAPARPPLEVEKIKAFSQKQMKTETVSNSSMAMEMPGALSWAKVAEDRNKQARLRMDVVKGQSQVCVPVGTAGAHLGIGLLQAQPAPCTTTGSPQAHLLAELTKALPQAHVSTKPTKDPSRGHPPAELTAAPAQSHLGMCLSKVQSQAHLPPKLTKAQSQAHLATEAIKVQSQVHLRTGLTKARSQAQLVTETAKSLYATHQAAELSSKTQSQPLLVGFQASTQPCQHVGTLPRAKPEDRLTRLPAHSFLQGKVIQGPCPGASETQNMLVPLLASAGHTTCNVESWEDGGATRAQPSTTSPAPPCQEELAASRLASLCVELATLLGSQEDLRALLAKALSHGEVRAALNQALSKEVLGASMAKALPQGILGAALAKARPWGELGTTLARALSRGELWSELTKAIPGRLAEVLSQALTEEELATLNQALCQGELGAVLSQSLSQAGLRSGVVLPKAAAKTAGRGMPVTPTPVEVDCRGRPSAAWRPALGPVRLQPSKVRVPWGGAWEGFITSWPSGLLEEMGEGAMFGGSPCSSVVSEGTSLTARVITTVHQDPPVATPGPTLSWEMEPSRDSLNLHLTSKVREDNVCLHPRASALASDLSPMGSDVDRNWPTWPCQQPSPSLWQSLVANGVGPSTSRLSLAGGSTPPSTHSPHEVSRVAPRSWASLGEGRVAPGSIPSATGRGRGTPSHQCAAAYGGSACWCQSPRVSRVPPGACRPSGAKGSQQPSMVPAETMQGTWSPNHKRASKAIREMTNKVTPSPSHGATVSKAQPRSPKACVITQGLQPGSLAPGHRWALKTQADPSLFQASPGNRLAPTLPRTAIPGQEKNQTRGTVSSVHCPQELMTNHILNELVATLPQGPDSDLARSFSQGSTGYGPNMSDSQSSLRSCSSLSLSTMSVPSMTAADLVEEESWEASFDQDLHLDALLSGEAVERSQGPGNMEETERADHRHMSPNLHGQSSTASKLIPTLHHRSVASRMTLSVHWGSDDETDMSSGQSSVNLKKSLSRKPSRTGLTRSLSLSNVVLTVCQQPSVASRLTPCLSQPTVASKVLPNPGQLSMASRVTSSLSEPSVASKMTPSLSLPSKASNKTPSLSQTSRTNRVDLCLGRPPSISGVALNLGQTSMTGGVVPSLAQPSVAYGVAPSLAQPSLTDGVARSFTQPLMACKVALSLAQPPVASEVAPSLAQSPVTGGVALSLAQPSMTTGVAPSLVQLPVTGGVAPSLGQPSVACGMAPSIVQPPMTDGMTPSLGQASRVGGVAPSLAQSSVTYGVAPNLGQPSLTIGVAPSLGQPSLTIGVTPVLVQPAFASGMSPSLGQPALACVVAPSLAQPSVIGGTGCALSQPSWAPRMGSNLLSSRVNAMAPSQHPPSFAIEVTSCAPHPAVSNSMGQGLSQPTVSTRGDPCQDLRMVSGVAPDPQAAEFSEVALGFHQPPSIGGRHPGVTEQPAVTVSAPNLYQASVARGEDSCLGQGTSIAQGILFRGMATSLSQGTTAADTLPNASRGTLATGMFLGTSQVPESPDTSRRMGRRSVATGLDPSQSLVARGMASITPRASVAGAPLICEPASRAGPGFSPASVPAGLGVSSSKFSLTSVGPSISQGSVSLPISLAQQCPSVSTVSASSYQQAGAVSHAPGGGVASGVMPGSTASRMTTAVAPGTMAGGVAPSLSPGSVFRGMAQRLPPESTISCVAPGLPLGYELNSVIQTAPPGSVIGGFGQGLPPGSTTGGMDQGLPSDPVTSTVAQGLPPGSGASGMATTLPLSSVATAVSPSLITASRAGGKRQGLSVRPSAHLIAPSLLLGSMTSGVGSSLPPCPVASSGDPASMPGGLGQNLVLGSMASTAGPPYTVAGVAPSLPQGSLLIGISPRPYHGALAGEASMPSFQVSHTPGLAQAHLQEANGTAKGVYQVPTVLQKASQLREALGMMPFETTGSQTVMKPEDPDKALPQGSLSRRESEVLEATPWMYHSPLATDIDYSQEFPTEDKSLGPKDQRPLLEEVTPRHTMSVTRGMASVPPQSPSFAKHSMARGGTPTLQQRSATNWGTPISPFVAVSGVPGVQTESVKGVGAPSAHPQTPVSHPGPRSPSVAHVLPRGHAHGLMASPVVPGSSKLAHGSAMTTSLHPVSVAGMGTPSTSRKSGATRGTTHVPLYPPLVKRGVSGGSQKEAVPSALQKPVSGDLIQNGHESLGPRRSFRSMHDTALPPTPDSSVAGTVPSHQQQEDAPRPPQEVPKPSTGVLPPAIRPIIRTSEVAHGTAIPRLNLGVRRVSLGYESSPSGSQRPLFNQESPKESRNSLSSVAPAGSHGAPLTPAVLQGPEDAGVSGGQAWNSAVPSVAVRPPNSTVAPGGTWEPARGTVPWDVVGSKAAVDPRRPGELVASVQAVEKIIIRAVVIIQACTRGFLVRRTIKVWHQWAIVIQAAWRGYCVRRDLARLCRAATIIQAAWRGFRIRQSHAQQVLLPGMWAEMGSGARMTSDHRCFQSCQPHACSLCQSLSSGLGSPPSVVMLVGSSPRTCHTCGHTLPTRVVHGTGRGAAGQASRPRGCISQSTPRSPRQPNRQNKAATAIQSAWRGFTVRRQLRQQQLAAKMLQATWRGHSTRASLTTDALLGPAMWDSSRHTQWPGV